MRRGAAPTISAHHAVNTPGCFGDHSVAAFIIEQRRAHYTQDLAAYQLKIEDLEALDEAHDGGVSELEYVKFMLVAMNKCDGALFDDLRDQFHRLDMTGDGQITKNDLKIMVTKKMKKASCRWPARDACGVSSLSHPLPRPLLSGVE